MGVVVINHKGVRMAHPIPAGDSTQHVCISCWQLCVIMLNHFGVLRRPDPGCHPRSQCTSSTQDYKAHRHSEARAKPAGQGIEQKPACMRERELSSEKRWPVLGVGGAPQQAP